MSNKTNSIEQFAEALTATLTELRARGIVPAMCAYPQPWNDPKFKPKFLAPGPAYVAPDWSFESFPEYRTTPAGMEFVGMMVYVSVRTGTMGGYSDRALVTYPDSVPATVDRLLAFRDDSLNKCRHFRAKHVAQLGRCYNRYECMDCGLRFEIDSGD